MGHTNNDKGMGIPSTLELARCSLGLFVAKFQGNRSLEVAVKYHVLKLLCQVSFYHARHDQLM